MQAEFAGGVNNSLAGHAEVGLRLFALFWCTFPAKQLFLLGMLLVNQEETPSQDDHAKIFR
ncbi:hypothetical protein [Noviherbaspirillum sedimenti]|uniref:hypothetical protein n=1 Tax=Noviherbaspirillum sedimenti TaxID=2320865 RepID=UPI0011C49EBE|nr:hypothetical protein [Noviherbaspirillum sedimenti]